MTLQDATPALELGSRELGLGGAALVLAGLALTPLCVAFARRFSPKVPVFFARWRFMHALVVALILMLAMQGAPALVGLVLDPERVPAGLRALLGSALGLGATCAVIFWMAARLDPDGVSCLGLRAQGSVRASWVAVACYVIVLPGLLGLMPLWAWIFQACGGEFHEQQIANDIAELSGQWRIYAALLAIFLLPFFEEVIFRGFLQPLLVQNLGDRGGVFATSLAFAMLHGESALVPVLGLALLLGSLKLRTQRLSACYAVHALHNAIAYGMLSLSDGA